MSSRMRVTKGHTRNRRAHHALKAPRLSECSNCGEYHLRHRVCTECGFYKGKQVLAKSANDNKPQKTEETVADAA